MSAFPEESASTLSLHEVTELLQKAGVDTAALHLSLTEATASVRQAAEVATTRPLAVTSAAINAAIRGSFLPSDLALDGAPSTTHATQLESLLSQSDVLSTGSQRAWQLKPDARRSILLQAHSAGLLAGEIRDRTSPTDARDCEGPLLRRVLAGHTPELDGMSLEELGHLATVAEWLAGTPLASLPAPEELRRLIGQREILDPFRLLVGRNVQAGSDGSDDRVVGRVKEMERLRVYVGVREPEELKFYVGRAFNSLWSTISFSDDANEPLLLKGIGGMGKSTLIAKFVLDHALFPDANLPFVYLDFDRATLAPRQPLQLLIEIAVQLGLWFPAMEASLKELRGSLRDAIDSQGRNVNRRERESVTGSELNAFCASLRAIVESFNKQSAPVLMLFDTFEVVQYDEEAVNGVTALIAALRQPDSLAWNGLRIVVAGRGDMAEIASSHEPVELRRLLLSATAQLLKRRSECEGLGLTRAHMEALAPALRNSPLDVIIVTNWLRDRVPEERARLIEDLVQEIEPEIAALGKDGADAEQRSSELVSRRITGILINRMIRHINDLQVRSLANPGLVVRIVTPEIIRKVMAPACGLSSSADPLPAGAEHELWRRLESERWLVTRRGNILCHRPEVRRSMLDLMRQQNQATFALTNDLALATFRQRAAEDDAARAEAIYHLLLGEKAALEEIDALWNPMVGRLLASAVDDLDTRGQGFLKAKLGRSVSVETLTSFSTAILLPLVNSFGRRYLQRPGPASFLKVLDSVTGVRDDPNVAGLRYEALYRSGRWSDLRETSDSTATLSPASYASALLWGGQLERLSAAGEPSLTALRFVLRWATRDPFADRVLAGPIERFTQIASDPVRVLDIPALCWDFAMLVTCAGSRGLPFANHQRQAILGRIAELCRTQARLPDAAAGSDALRILAFFETDPDRPILRRVDFDNHFATVSGGEIQALRNLVRVPLGSAADEGLPQVQRQHSNAVKRGLALLGRLKQFPDDVVIADVKITREFASVVRDMADAGSDRLARSVLQTLASKHPDWLQPLGGALTQAFDGEVPRKIGWWSSIDKYLGSGGKPRREKQNADGRSLLSLADEAASLAEAVEAYKHLLESRNGRGESENFLSLAQAFSAWVQMIREVVDDRYAKKPRHIVAPNSGDKSSRKSR